MRECTIPPLSRFTHKKPEGGYSVEISRDWMNKVLWDSYVPHLESEGD